MPNSVVYITDCDIPPSRAFALASYNASIAFTGVSHKNLAVSFSQAIKKQLNIICVNSGFGNTAASINLIANKAINLSHLRLDSSSYDKIPETFDKMNKMLDSDDKIYETIVDLV
jgi:threonine dehydrogenase-like Zn-dependent dehydrogenase